MQQQKNRVFGVMPSKAHRQWLRRLAGIGPFSPKLVRAKELEAIRGRAKSNGGELRGLRDIAFFLHVDVRTVRDIIRQDVHWVRGAIKKRGGGYVATETDLFHLIPYMVARQDRGRRRQVGRAADGKLIRADAAGGAVGYNGLAMKILKDGKVIAAVRTKSPSRP